MDTSTSFGNDMSSLSSRERLLIANKMMTTKMQELHQQANQDDASAQQVNQQQQQRQQQQPLETRQNTSLMNQAANFSFSLASQSMMGNMIPYVTFPPSGAPDGSNEEAGTLRDANMAPAEYMAALRQMQVENEARIAKELKRGLGPEVIDERKDGAGTVKYISTATAIDLANQVFGYNGWSSEIVEQSYQREQTKDGRWDCFATSMVKVTLRDGAFRTDVGHHLMRNQPCKWKAVENAQKSAASDALKRALKGFGPRLGNCLYDKQHLKNIKSLKKQPQNFDPSDLYRGEAFEREMREQDEFSKQALAAPNWSKPSTSTTAAKRTAPAPAQDAEARKRQAVGNPPAAAANARRSTTSAPAPRPAAVPPKPPHRHQTERASNANQQKDTPPNVGSSSGGKGPAVDTSVDEDGDDLEGEGIDLHLYLSQAGDGDEFWNSISDHQLDEIEGLSKAKEAEKGGVVPDNSDKQPQPKQSSVPEKEPAQPASRAALQEKSAQDLNRGNNAQAAASKTVPPKPIASTPQKPAATTTRPAVQNANKGQAATPANRSTSGQFVPKPHLQADAYRQKTARESVKVKEETSVDRKGTSKGQVTIESNKSLSSIGPGSGSGPTTSSDEICLSPQRRNVQELGRAQGIGLMRAAGQTGDQRAAQQQTPRRSDTPYSRVNANTSPSTQRATPRRSFTSGAALKDLEQSAKAARDRERSAVRTSGRPIAAATAVTGTLLPAHRSPSAVRTAPAAGAPSPRSTTSSNGHSTDPFHLPVTPRRQQSSRPLALR